MIQARLFFLTITSFCLGLLPWQFSQAQQQMATPASLAASGEIVLLDFSADWCGPCRQMAPLIGEIGAAGWLVRHVDVDQEHDLVKRFNVTGVPCYILLVKGHEVGRINGATTRSELEKLLAQSRKPLGLPALPANAELAASQQIPGIPVPTRPATMPLETEPASRPTLQPPATLSGPPAATATELPLDRPLRQRGQSQPRQPLPPPPTLAAQTEASLRKRLLQATARLRVQDPQGASWGTGTVIDCRQGEALILTCGHIFRDSEGSGVVEVDLFGAPTSGRLAGQMVAYDLDRDLALVSVFTDTEIEVVPIGGVGRPREVGEGVVTVGCDGGRDPTMHVSRVTSVDKYLGPANVQVAGQPVQGRSGGGLFALDGTLLGVCNAADPEDNEGLFAALPSIHEHLDEAGLAFVYRHVYPGTTNELAKGNETKTLPHMPDEMPPFSLDRRDRSDALPTASPGPAAAVASTNSATQAEIASLSPSQSLPAVAGQTQQEQSVAAEQTAELSAGEQALLDQVRQHGGNAEVICIVRPQGSSQSTSEIFLLKTASRDFLDRLSEAHQMGEPHQK